MKRIILITLLGITSLFANAQKDRYLKLSDTLTNGKIATKNFVLKNSDGTSLLGGSGTYIKDGKVNIGVNLPTIGTTNEGLLTGPTALIIGDLITRTYAAFAVLNDEVNMSAVESGSGGGFKARKDLSWIDFGGQGAGLIRISLDETGAKIRDGITNKGLGDAEDYSANKTDYSYATKKMLESIFMVSEYTDNAAALAAGLQVSKLYRTGDLLKIVH